MTKREWAIVLGFVAFVLGLISFFLSRSPFEYAAEVGRAIGIKR